METLIHSEPFVLDGRSTLRAWKKGVIPFYLVKGYSLAEAKEAALKHGALEHEHTVHNLVTSLGKVLAGAVLIGSTDKFLEYAAIGTSATIPLTSDTLLGDEVARLATVSLLKSGTTLTASVFFLASLCTYAIKEVGWFGGAAASATPDTGILYCHYQQTYDNSAGLKDLTFDYNILLG